MKRLLLVLLILIPLVLLGVWLAKRPAPPWNVKMTMTFLGFTNAVAGAPPTNALFGFNDIPSGDFYWDTKVRQFDGTKWVFLKKPFGQFAVFQPGGILDGGPTNYFLRGTITVGSTLAPTRVVMCLTREPSVQIEEMWEATKQVGARLLGLEGPDHVQYFMTNDFNFTSSTGPPP